jgi:phycoerythrin-associated linker protein
MLLPLNAQKKMQSWIRSRHLICTGNFLVFESLDLGAVDRFTECIEVLGGTLISVEPAKRIWMGEHRQIFLYRAKASLFSPWPDIKNYWLKYGSFRTRFDVDE